MERYENELEKSRSETLKTLGFLCYNRCVDGMWTLPDIKAAVEKIKEKLNYCAYLNRSSTNREALAEGEAALDEQILELGCICYNHYIDNSVFDSQVMYFCKMISEINAKIASARERAAENLDDTLKVDCPYGMEPIPNGYIQCACGYRNRAEARYCAKCGVKLRI